MKYFKYYAIGLFIILILAYTVRSELLIKKLRTLSASVLTEEIIEDNTVELPAEVENDNIELQIAEAETIRVTEFVYLYADLPETDDDIAQVNEYIDFLPDESIDVSTILEEDTRIAITYYKYPNALKDYSVTLKIKYDYKHTKFIIEPQELRFEAERDFRYTFSLFATSQSQIGVFLQYGIWRFSIGSGLLVNKNIEGVALISLGWEF